MKRALLIVTAAVFLPFIGHAAEQGQPAKVVADFGIVGSWSEDCSEPKFLKVSIGVDGQFSFSANGKAEGKGEIVRAIVDGDDLIRLDVRHGPGEKTVLALARNSDEDTVRVMALGVASGEDFDWVIKFGKVLPFNEATATMQRCPLGYAKSPDMLKKKT